MLQTCNYQLNLKLLLDASTESVKGGHVCVYACKYIHITYIHIYMYIFSYLERTVAGHIVYILHKWFVNMDIHCLHSILTVAVKP